MKVIYNQKENYIKHIEQYCLPIIETFKDMGLTEQAQEAYDIMVTKKINCLNDILNNGLDTGTIGKNIEKVIDIAYDEQKCNEGIEYAYHGECFYFVVKRDKKNILFDADVVLARM